MAAFLRQLKIGSNSKRDNVVQSHEYHMPTSNFLIKQMMQNPEMLKEYLNYLQKPKEEDKIEEPAGSSESTFDPFDDPIGGQNPNDFWKDVGHNK